MMVLQRSNKCGSRVLAIATTLVKLLALAGISSGLAYATNSRYEINGGEIYDKSKDLTWQRCSIGQSWKEGKGCEGTINSFTFQEAQKQGAGKWRVPTKDELVSLVDKTSTSFPAIDAETFPNMNEDITGYWTSSSNEAERAWDVRFTSGNVVNDVSSRRFGVRLVRNGK
jgi:hypothetical protein